jgi:hypothetical protein
MAKLGECQDKAIKAKIEYSLRTKDNLGITEWAA